MAARIHVMPVRKRPLSLLFWLVELSAAADAVAELDLCHNANVQNALIALRNDYHPIIAPAGSLANV